MQIPLTSRSCKSLPLPARAAEQPFSLHGESLIYSVSFKIHRGSPHCVGSFCCFNCWYLFRAKEVLSFEAGVSKAMRNEPAHRHQPLCGRCEQLNHRPQTLAEDLPFDFFSRP